MITPEMRQLIEQNTIGLVATVTPDGSPCVSPKGTTVVLDDRHVVFSNIRSPQTVSNIQSNPAVGLNFIDVFRRKACRLKGTAIYWPRGERRYKELLPHFLKWDALVERMRGFVVVEVTGAQLLLSPAYDDGTSEDELRRKWLKYYIELLG